MHFILKLVTNWLKNNFCYIAQPADFTQTDPNDRTRLYRPMSAL